MKAAKWQGGLRRIWIWIWIWSHAGASVLMSNKTHKPNGSTSTCPCGAGVHLCRHSLDLGSIIENPGKGTSPLSIVRGEGISHAADSPFESSTRASRRTRPEQRQKSSTTNQQADGPLSGGGAGVGCAFQLNPRSGDS